MDSTTLFVVAILFAAAFLQSATGFGLALVGMALVPLVMPVHEAIAFVSLASFGVNVFVMIANHSGFSWRRALPLVTGTCLGIPAGYFFLRSLDSEWIVRLLGYALVLIALLEFGRKRIAKLPIPEKAGFPLSLVGGMLAGAFNVGGPPVVIYAYSRPWSRVETVAVLQTVFISAAIVRNLLMAQSGEINGELLRLVGVALPPAAVAVWLGKLTLERLPEVWLRRSVYGLILVIGLRYVFSG